MELNQLLKQWSKLQQQVQSVAESLRDISRLGKEPTHYLPDLILQITQLEKHAEQLTELPQHCDALTLWIQQMREQLAEAEQPFKQNFGRELSHRLISLDLELSGQYPELRAGFFTIEPDIHKAQATVWYGPKQERMSVCALSPVEVAKQVQSVQKQLGANMEPQEMAHRLEKAYHRTLPGNEGEPAPINEVLPEFAYLMQDERFHRNPEQDLYRSYTRADFSYDLYGLRQWFRSEPSQPRRLQLIVATRAHTRKRQDFLWIPETKDGRGTTYSHLLFREAAHE